jgi:uncharacterized protein involved in exopolysaccharide biosynthesis
MNDITPTDNAMQIQSHFDMTAEMIQADIAEYAAFDITDFSDPAQIRKLQEGLRVLQKKRTSITTAGKAWREASNAYNKAVLSMEKELLALVTPVEHKLKTYANTLQLLELRESNKLKHADRLTALQEVGMTLDENTILEMDDDQFSAAIESHKIRLKQDELAVERFEAWKEAGRKQMEANEKVKVWLHSIWFNPLTDYMANTMNEVKVYRLIDTLKLP